MFENIPSFSHENPFLEVSSINVYQYVDEEENYYHRVKKMASDFRNIHTSGNVNRYLKNGEKGAHN